MEREYPSHKRFAEREPMAVSLVTNETLNRVVQALAGAEIDWDKIAVRYLQLNPVPRDEPLPVLLGKLGEINLHLQLKKVEECQDLNFNTEPIPDNMRHEPFRYHRTVYGGYQVNTLRKRRKPTKESEYAEYDALTTVDGLPVVWEVKTSQMYHPHMSVIQRGRVEKRLKPITTIFRTEKVGFVLVTPKAPAETKREIIGDFLKMGGIVAPISVNLQQFTRQVSRLRSKYYL